jgi:lipoyl(octanoyl) transferase
MAMATCKLPENFIAKVEGLKISWLGQKSYESALKIQREITDKVRSQVAGPEILACEHDAVITLGKRGQPLSDVLASFEELREKKIEIVATDRGGQATLHNPGQLVIYPILPLRDWGLGVRVYVECLERASALFFAEFGIEVIRGYEPGLWINEKKIAAFGIRVDRGVSLHGLALNIFNDLSLFSMIKQCGMQVKPTNLKNEMAEFMALEGLPYDSKATWDFEKLANQWLGLFKLELLNLKPHSKGLNSFELDVALSDPLKP